MVLPFEEGETRGLCSIDSQSIHIVSDPAKCRAQGEGVPLPHVLVEQMGAVPKCFSSNWRILFCSS